MCFRYKIVAKFCNENKIKIYNKYGLNKYHTVFKKINIRNRYLPGIRLFICKIRYPFSCIICHIHLYITWPFRKVSGYLSMGGCQVFKYKFFIGGELNIVHSYYMHITIQCVIVLWKVLICGIWIKNSRYKI